MTELKLLKLVLKNFKGRNFTFEPNGHDASVFGDNGSGKTTIADAMQWLLFGKDSQGNDMGDAVKNLDENNNVIHFLEHEVEGIFLLNGKKKTFTRMYKEFWPNKKGTPSTTFSGHQSKYQIDGIPCGTEREYNDAIASIAPIFVFRMLTSPTFFNDDKCMADKSKQGWKRRREVLIEVCGDVSDEDVIASDKSLEKLSEILAGRTTDDYRKLVNARQAKINEQIKKIPSEIKGILSVMPEIEQPTGHIPAEIERLKKLIEEKRQEVARIENGGEIAEKKKLVAEIDGEILRLKNVQWKKENDLQKSKQSELTKAQGVANSIAAEITFNKRHIENIDRDLTRLVSSRNVFLSEWHKENESAFAIEQGESCPSCGQALPVEQLAEARNKAEAAFNLAKSNKLESISKQGRAARSDIERLQGEKESLEMAIASKEIQLKEAQNEVGHLQAELDSVVIFSDIRSQIEEKTKEKEVVGQSISDLQSGSKDTLEAVNQQILTYNQTLQTLENIMRDVDQIKRNQVEISKLSAAEKTLSSEYEKLSGHLYLIDRFIKAKVSMLDERINSKFKIARFKMFDVQINGGLDETCETLFDGVPYSSASNGQRGLLGLDIIATLSEHYGFKPVVFYDNAESLTKFPDMQAQLIRLVVSDADKVLRVVVDG